MFKIAHQSSLLAALFVSMKWIELISSFRVQTFPRHLRSHLQPPGGQKVPWALVPMLPIVQAGSEEFAAPRYVQLQEYYWTVLLLKGAVTKLLWQPIWRLEDISLPVPLSGPRIEKNCLFYLFLAVVFFIHRHQEQIPLTHPRILNTLEDEVPLDIQMNCFASVQWDVKETFHGSPKCIMRF